jgi:anaerobic dimethyl sulfoxide reductase subunit C (anchor subunit)
MQWRKISTIRERNILAGIAADGIALVYSMSNVHLPAPELEPGDNAISFFTTTLLLGALAMGAAFVANYWYAQRKNPGCASDLCVLLRDSIRWIAVSSIVLLGIEFVVLPLTLAYLVNAGAAASVGMMVAEFGVIFGLRLALVFLGAGIFGVFLYRASLAPGQEQTMGQLAYLAFALVFVSEVLGRFLFYATAITVGLQ